MIGILLFITICMDYLLLSLLRDVITDMFLSSRSRSFYRKLKKEQNIQKRITMTYITPYIKNPYSRPYKRFRLYYISKLISLIVVYSGIIVLLFLDRPLILQKFCLFDIAFNILCIIILRIFVFPDGINSLSVYRKKRK